jgi:quercetin dioxygenase-like cupin family protein
MELVNAIAKVRFSSVRPQRVRLHHDGTTAVDLLCFEPGQDMPLPRADRAIYVIAGSARLAMAGCEHKAAAGQLAALNAGESVRLAAEGEQRLICVVLGAAT